MKNWPALNSSDTNRDKPRRLDADLALNTLESLLEFLISASKKSITKYDGNQWTKLDQYLMPGVTCQGNCPLTLKTGRDPGNPGYCR